MDTNHARTPFPGLQAAFVAVLAGLFGCATENEMPAVDHGVTSIQFDDIPIPAGMRLKTEGNESHSHVAGEEFRYGDFEYIGRMPIAEAATYMRERMRLHDWEATAQETGPDGSQTLRFERRPYVTTCTIRRDPDTKNTLMSVAVRTRIEDQ